ncbi:MAG: hypothetical protein C4K48_08855 [Candidatus Thorarchaeota archaeon]|nr:MAG: hypothetical protein C4K48_08855 [Candidatus Thorarchaeota archaeon]
MIDFKDIRKRTTSVRGYVDALSEKDKDIIIQAYKEYRLNEVALRELKVLAKGLKVVVFSAAWCGDCKRAMPVMLHLEEQTGIDVMVFGNIKTDPLNKAAKWRVPPSPPEMNKWGVTAIPWFEFFDAKGNKIGTLIEKPTVKDTLEEEIVHVLKNK